jgi:hypothetical protein
MLFDKKYFRILLLSTRLVDLNILYRVFIKYLDQVPNNNLYNDFIAHLET